MFPSSDSIGQIAGALARAQAELVNPPKVLRATLVRGPGLEPVSYRYAPLSTGLTIVRRVLGRHEIAVVQTTQVCPEAGSVDLTTVLVHASGEWIGGRWPVCGADARQDPKLMGAALTYARRYSLFALVGVAGEDDLDAPNLARVSAAPGVTGSTGSAGRPLTRKAPRRRERPARSARVIPLRVVAAGEGSGEPRTGDGAGEVSSGQATVSGLIAELEAVADEAGLTRWALAALPHRDALTGDERIQLEAALAKKAANLLPEGAQPSSPRPSSDLPSPAPTGTPGDDHATPAL
jgi:hypothetical protein